MLHLLLDAKPLSKTELINVAEIQLNKDQVYWNRYWSPLYCTIPVKIKSLIARCTGHTWGQPGTDRTQVGPIMAPWSLLSWALLPWENNSAKTQKPTSCGLPPAFYWTKFIQRHYRYKYDPLYMWQICDVVRSRKSDSANKFYAMEHHLN